MRIRQPRLGTRKLCPMLREPLAGQWNGLGLDALFDVLRDAGMLVQTREVYHKTTNYHHWFRQHLKPLKARHQ